MKRRLVCLVMLFLIGVLLCANAETIPYTLEQKLEKQLGAGSGLRGVLTVSLEGAAMPFFDAQTWQVLSAHMLGLTADITYIAPQGVQLGNSQTILTVKTGDEILTEAVILGNGKLLALRSDLLSDGFIGAADAHDALTSAITGSITGWPPLWNAVYALLTAEDQWNTAADSALATYTAKLGVWMKAYTTLATVTDDKGVTLNRYTWIIPAPAVKAEIQQLLIDLYSDETLLALLREKLTAREAAAYLEKSMMPDFFKAIDLLALDEDVKIVRTYDKQGTIINEQLDLPLTGAQGISKLLITRALGAGGEMVTSIETKLSPVHSENETGGIFRLTISGSATTVDTDEEIYTGTVYYLPESSVSRSFAVDGSQQTQAGEISLSYNLYIAKGAETYDAANDIRTRGYEITLAIKPEGGQGIISEQSFSETASLSSASSSRSSTKVNATFTWQDLQSGSRISIAFNGRTAAPWTVQVLEDTALTRIDLMTAEEFSAWMKQTADTLRNRLKEIVLTLGAQ